MSATVSARSLPRAVWDLNSLLAALDPKAELAERNLWLVRLAEWVRHAPIRVTAIEKRLKTRYTVDTLSKLPRLYPRHRFIWLMGSDNLAQFHKWEGWRRIARKVPIAVVARPGYIAPAHASPAMSWLRRFVRPAGQAKHWTRWRLPALVLLRFRPDRTSATSLRAADPAWHRRFASSLRIPGTDSSQP